MRNLDRPLPIINEMNEYFWKGGADGRLHILRCSSCGLYFHPYQAICNVCGSKKVRPEPVSGRGTVLSKTVNYQPWFRHVPTPYAVALIELEERGPVRLVSNIFDCHVDDVIPGMAVEVCFEKHEDLYIPFFRPPDYGARK